MQIDPHGEIASYGSGMFRTLRPAQIRVDMSIAGLFAVAGLAVYSSANSISTIGPLAAHLILAGALALRRVSPSLSLAAAWVASLFQMATDQNPTYSDLAVLVVLFATAAYGGRAVKWLGFASTFVGALAVALYLITFPAVRYYNLSDFLLYGASELLASGEWVTVLVNTAGAFIAALAVFMLSWVLGLMARLYLNGIQSRHAQADAEAKREKAVLDVMVEQERTRIARDMHDIVAHSLAVVIAQADGARYARAQHPESIDAALDTISLTAREALGDVRVLLGQLRHSDEIAPQPVLADLARLVEQMRGSGLTLAYQVHGRPGSLATGQQLALYRVTQEALTNALRHADTTQEVFVDLSWNTDTVTARISSGLSDTTRMPIRIGHGLAGMRERALLVGGNLAAGIEGTRFVVHATVPRIASSTGAIAEITLEAAR